MISKNNNGTAKPRARHKLSKIDWERRQRFKDYFDSLSPEEHERELKKLSSEDLFFLVADTVRANYKPGRQSE